MGGSGQSFNVGHSIPLSHKSNGMEPAMDLDECKSKASFSFIPHSVCRKKKLRNIVVGFGGCWGMGGTVLSRI